MWWLQLCSFCSRLLWLCSVSYVSIWILGFFFLFLWRIPLEFFDGLCWICRSLWIVWNLIANYSNPWIWTFFHLSLSSLVSFSSVLWFSVSNSFTPLAKFIPKCFILLVAIVNRIISLIFSFCSSVL